MYIRELENAIDEKEKPMSQKESIQTDNAPRALGPYSQACRIGPALYVSGQLGIDPVSGTLAEGFDGQARQALQNLRVILEAAGFEMKDVVQVQIFLTDMQAFSAINEVYKTFFAHPYPARAVVQVSALPAGGRVEIMAVAQK
jgi:2-iminobutanoate/2-iminopropanoate deaminase